MSVLNGVVKRTLVANQTFPSILGLCSESSAYKVIDLLGQ